MSVDPARSFRLLAALGLAACSRSPGTAPEPSDSAEATLAAASSELDSSPAAPERATSSRTPRVVHLLDAGRPPRRKLRYRYRADRDEQLTMSLDTALSQVAKRADAGPDAHETPLPNVVVVVAIHPSAVSDEGAMTYGWRVSSTEVQTEPGAAESQLAEAMRSEVATIAHLSGTAFVSSQGVTERMDGVPGDSGRAGHGGGHMVEQVEETLRDLAVPWPEEAVGIGARWQSIAHLGLDEGGIAQTDDFRLQALSATTGVVEDALAQTMPRQLLTAESAGTNPAEDAAARPAAIMDSTLASGRATVRFDLGRFVPTSNFSGTTTMVLSGPSALAGDRALTLVLRIHIALTGTIR